MKYRFQYKIDRFNCYYLGQHLLKKNVIEQKLELATLSIFSIPKGLIPLGQQRALHRVDFEESNKYYLNPNFQEHDSQNHKRKWPVTKLQELY